MTGLDVAVARLRMRVMSAEEDIPRAASPTELAACTGRLLGLKTALADVEALACKSARAALEAVS